MGSISEQPLSEDYLNTQALGRRQPNDISVLIVGAGVGGLTAALECWRKGCSVRIVDRMPHELLAGDSFTIGPSATNSFSNWPELSEAVAAIAYDPQVIIRKSPDGEVIIRAEFTQQILPAELQALNVRLLRYSRPDLFRVLAAQLTRIGLRVEYDMEVVDYHEDAHNKKGTAILKNGSKIEANLVIAADGLRSKGWKIISGKETPARSSGLAVFRAAYPIECALKDPMVAERFPLSEDGRSVIEVWQGKDIQLFMFRNQKEFQWVMSHDDTGSAEESWHHRVSAENALAFTSKIDNWPEVGDRLIKTTPPGVLIDWRLMWRDPQATWVSPAGRVLQLGDAAHTFLPNSGSGAVQAIEDAVSIATCLDLAGKDNIELATRIHNLLRFERTSCLQALGVVNHAKSTGQWLVNGKPSKPLPEFGSWMILHDAEKYATDNYQAAMQHLTQGTTFVNTNIPPGLKYIPWTIDNLLNDHKRGVPTILDGQWS